MKYIHLAKTGAHLCKKQGFSHTEEALRRVLFLLVAAAPDMHFFCIGNELFPEIRVSDGNKRFGAFPGRKSLQVGHTIFGDDVMRAGARVGADGSRRQRGNDTTFDRAVLARNGGGHTDKALASL